MNYKDILGLSGALLLLAFVAMIIACVLYVKFDIPYIIRVLRNMLIISLVFFVYANTGHAAEAGGGIKNKDIEIDINTDKKEEVSDNNNPVIGDINFVCDGDKKVSLVGENLYITSNTDEIKIEINTIDKESGIDEAKTVVYLNEIKQSFKLYNDNIIILLDKSENKNKFRLNKVFFQVFDRAGNSSKKEFFICIDPVSPQIEYSIKGNIFSKEEDIFYYVGKNLGPDLCLLLNVSDDYNLKGFKIFKEEKLLNHYEGDLAKGQKSIYLSLKENIGKVRIEAEDLAGNKTIKEVTFIRDNQAPMFNRADNSIKLTDSLGLIKRNENVNAYFTEDKKITVIAEEISDSESGIKDVYFIYESNKKKESIKATLKDGVYFAEVELSESIGKISVFAMDNLGQTSYYQEKEISIYSGNSKPEIFYDMSKDVYDGFGKVSFKDKCNLKILIKDDLAIKDILIKLDDKIVYEEEDIFNKNDSENKFENKKIIELDIAKNIGNKNSALLVIYATNYFAKTISDDKYTFVKDFRAPVIEDVYFGNQKASSDNKRLFFNNDVKLKVKVCDYDNKSEKTPTVSNVKVLFCDKNGAYNGKLTTTYISDGNYEYNLKAPFNGFVAIEAVDNFGNAIIGDKTKIICENKDTFIYNCTLKLNKSADISVHSTDVNILFSAKNSFAGISDILYTVKNVESGNIASGKWIDIGSKDNLNIAYENGVVSNVSGVIPVDFEGNNIEVIVRLIDNCGFEKQESLIINIDKSRPLIKISFDDEKEGGIFNKNREAVISVIENNFDKNNADIEIKNTLGYIPKIKGFFRKKADVYEAKVSFDCDGDYEMSVSFTDKAGNFANYGPVSFTIDTKAPVIEMDFDKNNDNSYFNEKRVATIKVTDRSFDENLIEMNAVSGSNQIPKPGKWKSFGDTHYCNIVFDKEGEYEFVITGFDKAGNESKISKSNKFILDLIKPKISIFGITDGEAYRDDADFRIKIYDKNFFDNKYSIKLNNLSNKEIELKYKKNETENGVWIYFDDLPKTKEYDGIYKLIVSAQDLAGNYSSEDLTFSINRFGSSYYIRNESEFKNHKFVKNPSEIEICEVNTDELMMGECSPMLLKNGYLYELKKDFDYTVVNEKNGFKNCYIYRISKALFSEDGVYVLSLYSRDRAGNVNALNSYDSLCQIAFGVDNTPPLVYMLSSISDYTKPGKTVYAFVKDNLFIDKVKVKINGRAVDYTIDGEILKFKITGKNKNPDIQIEAVDSAGNAATLL